jgi:hypothetical protein
VGRKTQSGGEDSGGPLQILDIVPESREIISVLKNLVLDT